MDILKLAAENSPRSKMIYHEDTQALHIGTLDKHCYFVPFAKGRILLRTVKFSANGAFKRQLGFSLL